MKKLNKKELQKQIDEVSEKMNFLDSIRYDYRNKLTRLEDKYDKNFVKKIKLKVTYLDWDGKVFHETKEVTVKDYDEAFNITFDPYWADECVEYAYVTKNGGAKKYFSVDIGCDQEYGEIWAKPITFKDFRERLKEHKECMVRIHETEQKRFEERVANAWQEK